MLWRPDVAVMFMSQQERKLEETRELDAEVLELDPHKANSSVELRIRGLKDWKRVNIDPLSTGDLDEWGAFKAKIAEEKTYWTQTMQATWAWEDEAKVYNEIK